MIGRGVLARAQLRVTEWLPDGLFSARDDRLSPIPETFDQSDAALARSWLRRSARAREDLPHEFAHAFAAWNGSRHAFAFAAGRVALSACISALGLEPGDEVIVPGYTCVVVPNAFSFAGVRVVYADIELDTYGLDADSALRRLTPKTRAILLHHLYGLVCRDYERVLTLARERNLKVIEDCCHATGAEYQGQKVGNRGDVAFYSSEQSKVFNTIMGGIAVTNDAAIARGLETYYQRAEAPRDGWAHRLLRNVLLSYHLRRNPKRTVQSGPARVLYGPDPFISISADELAGRRPPDYAQRMAGPIAALGLHQLRKIDGFNETRRRWAEVWQRWCTRRGYRPATVIPGSRPVFLRYPVLVEPEKKADTRWARQELQVELGNWFATHLHPVDRPVEGCPNAALAVRRCVNLPCGVTRDARLDSQFA